MEHEYIEDIAGELGVEAETLLELIDRLGIKRQPLAVPPYGADVSSVVSHEDAMRLRHHLAAKPAGPV